VRTMIKAMIITAAAVSALAGCSAAVPAHTAHTVKGEYMITKIVYPSEDSAQVYLRWMPESQAWRMDEPQLKLGVQGGWSLISTKHLGPDYEVSTLEWTPLAS
jgi:hypothetical protein